MFELYRREYQIRLPLPLAQLYTRSNGAPDARSSHDFAFSLFEALIKLATAPLAAAYLEDARTGGVRAEQVDSALTSLAQPSLGHWVGMLRELARHFGSRPHPEQHPLGHLWKQLNRRYPGQTPLPSLYRRIKNGVDAKPAGDKSCTPLELINALVQYRNEVIGHGGARPESFYSELSQLLFNAATELLDEANLDPIGPAGSRLVYISQLRIIDIDRVEVGLQELVGLRGESMPSLRLSKAEADVLLPQRVAVAWPGRSAPLRLDPILSYSEGSGNPDLLFLNGGFDGTQIKYLSAFTGNVERDQANAQTFAAILALLRTQSGSNGSAQEEPKAPASPVVPAAGPATIAQTPVPPVRVPAPEPPPSTSAIVLERPLSPATASPAPAPASAVKPAAAAAPPPLPKAASSPNLGIMATGPAPAAAPPPPKPTPRPTPPPTPTPPPAHEPAKCPGCGAALPFGITSQFAGEKVRFRCRKCGTSFRLKPPPPPEEEMVLLTTDGPAPAPAPEVGQPAPAAQAGALLSKLKLRLPRLDHPFASEVTSRLSSEYLRLGPFFLLALAVGVTIIDRLPPISAGPGLVRYVINVATVATIILILQLMLQPARVFRAVVGAVIATVLGDILGYFYAGIPLVSHLYAVGVGPDPVLFEKLGLTPPGLIIVLSLAISLPALPVLLMNLAGFSPQPVPTRLRSLWQRLAHQIPFLNEHWMHYFEEARAGLWAYFLVVCWVMLIYPFWHPVNQAFPSTAPGMVEVGFGLVLRWAVIFSGVLWIRSRRMLSLWLLPFRQADPAEEPLNQIARLHHATWGPLGTIGRVALGAQTLPPPLEALRAQHNQALVEYRGLTGQLQDFTSGPDLRRRRRECQAQLHQAQRRMAAIERHAGRQVWEAGATPAELSWASTQLDTLLPQIARAEALLKTSEPPFPDSIEASAQVDPEIERRRYIREESLVRSVGMVYELMGVLFAITALRATYDPTSTTFSFLFQAGMVLAFTSVPLILLGRGLCQLKSWARWCALVFASLALAIVMMGAAFLVFGTSSAHAQASGGPSVPPPVPSSPGLFSTIFSIQVINSLLMVLLFATTIRITVSPRFSRLYTPDYREIVASTPRVRRALSPGMRAVFFTAVSLALLLKLAGAVSDYMALPASTSSSSPESSSSPSESFLKKATD